jgi:hypothetical protein
LTTDNNRFLTSCLVGVLSVYKENNNGSIDNFYFIIKENKVKFIEITLKNLVILNQQNKHLIFVIKGLIKYRYKLLNSDG